MTTALFACVHHAGPSQMSAFIFNTLAQKLGLPVSASSAGQGMDATREIRDTITRKVLGLLQAINKDEQDE